MQASKPVIAALIALGMSLSAVAQTRGPQARLLAASAPAPAHVDLNASLNDLDRVAQATNNDIASLHIENWKSATWKTGFIKHDSKKQQVGQAARSLRRNLTSAMPGLIRDVQTSRGGLSATFKLYDDLSLTCELLDSVLQEAESMGKKDEYGVLADDFSAMSKLRREIASYIQTAAASLENKGRLPYYNASAPVRTAASQPTMASTVTPASGTLPKKIVIDDTIPEKKPVVKKKATASFSNQAE